MSQLAVGGTLAVVGVGLYLATLSAMKEHPTSATWSEMAYTEKAPFDDYLGKVFVSNSYSPQGDSDATVPTQNGLFTRKVSEPYQTVSMSRPSHVYGVMGSGQIDLSDNTPRGWNMFSPDNSPTASFVPAFTNDNTLLHSQLSVDAHQLKNKFA